MTCRFAAVLVLFGLTACAGGGTSGIVPAPSAPGAGGNVSALASERLAVVDTFPANNVKLFDAAANGNVPPSFTMSDASFQLNFPSGAAFDGSGNLYVTNEVTPSVTVYSFSSSGIPTLVRTIDGSGTGLNNPQSIAVDAAGHIFVASLVTPPINAKIDEFAAGASGDAAPIATIEGADTHLSGPISLAVDSAGNLYATSSDFFVLEFAPGSNGDAAPKRMISAINDDPIRPGGFLGVGVDADRNVYVTAALFGAGCNQAPAIVVYAPDLASRLRYISGSKTGITEGTGHANNLAVDPAGTVFMTNPLPTSGRNGPNAISVFAPHASGNASPIANIAGSATGISGSQESLAVH